MLPMYLIMSAPLWGLLLFLVAPLRTALPLYVVLAGLGAGSHVLMRRAARRRVVTGTEGLVGATATVVSWHGTRGEVRCHGELWQARCSDSTAPPEGSRLEVLAVEHLTLVVARPAQTET